MHKNSGLYLLLMVILSLISCKDNEDSSRPEIVFVEPAANTTIFLPDTVKVVADVKDDKVITAVELGLLDDDGTRILAGGFYYPGTMEYRLTSYMVIDDKSLKSGTYKLKVTASDGVNISNEYLPVFINEIPLAVKGYLAITASYPFKTRITRLAQDYREDTTFIIPKSFLLAGLHGLWEQFYFVSQEPSTILTMSVTDFQPLWEYGAGMPRPKFTGLISDTELLFATANGDAGILNEQGQIDLRTSPQLNSSIDCFAADDKYLYAEMVALGGDTRHMTAFYRVTGVIRVQKLVADDIVDLLPMQGKAVMLLSSGTQTNIAEFDPEEMLITNLETFSKGAVLSSLKLSEDEALIFTDQMVLYFNYQYHYLTGYLQKPYRFGRYDDLDDLLYLVSDSTVDIYRGSTSGFLGSMDFDEQVKDFLVIFNKK